MPPTLDYFPGLTMPGHKILIMGPIGSGKTHSIRTWLKQKEIQPFLILTESKSLSVLGDVIEHIPFRMFVPKSTGFVDLHRISKKIQGAMEVGKDQAGGKPAIDSRTYDSHLNFLECLNNFVDRKGVSYGPVDSWGTDRVLIIDSLTGINEMTRRITIGSRVGMSQTEYGICQSLVKDCLDALATICACHVVVTCHVDFVRTEASPIEKMVVKTHGNKLGPVLPANWNELLLAVHEGSNFYWKSAHEKADLRTELFSSSPADNNPQDFSLMMKAWKNKGGKIVSTDEYQKARLA